MKQTRIEMLEIEASERVTEREALRNQIDKIGARLTEIRREVAHIRRVEEAEKMEVFWRELGERFGVLDSPKFKTLCDKAWEEGRSEGLDGMRNCFADLVDLIK